MRYKEFNANVVLEKCITMFWNRGFTSCSISEIVEQTRVNRYSLYEEFGSKEGILAASIKLYAERYGKPKIEELEGEGNLAEVCFDFYWKYLAESDDRPFGCYMIHIGTELADINEDVRKSLDEYLDLIRKAFVTAMRKRNVEEDQLEFLSGQLVGLFCTAVSFCLIHTVEQRRQYVQNCIKVILNNTKENVTATA